MMHLKINPRRKSLGYYPDEIEDAKATHLRATITTMARRQLRLGNMLRTQSWRCCRNALCSIRTICFLEVWKDKTTLSSGRNAIPTCLFEYHNPLCS